MYSRTETRKKGWSRWRECIEESDKQKNNNNNKETK